MTHTLVSEGSETTTSWGSFWEQMVEVGDGHLIWGGRDDFSEAAAMTAWQVEHSALPMGFMLVVNCGLVECCNPAHMGLREVAG